MVKDVNPGAEGSTPLSFTTFNGALYFQANDGTHGRDLWRTDGTAEGTVMVKDIGVSTSIPTVDVDLFVFNDALFFHASDGDHGWELWRTDGTAAGTVMVKDINPGAADAFSAYP